ncbi:hypothetical protein V490_08517 [Pseudogymnoascus sp. VKM F-3557]|nr:hypothetical protein V490_08517 [Pseudogymnoascus sp. VKM F-3557]
MSPVNFMMRLQPLYRQHCPSLFRISKYSYSTTAEKPAEPPTEYTEKKIVYPDRLNANHHDLETYLAYASRSGLDSKSTVFVGTHYEYTVQEVLKRLGFSLQQTGGASDYGIDLLGEWKLPGVPLNLRVLVQCKALAKKSGPNFVRELEGAFAGAPSGWQGNGVIGLLVSQKPATKGMREALARSRWPMGAITCTGEGRLVQMLWNNRANEEGLTGVGVGIRYKGGSLNEEEIHLTFKGENMEIEP